MREVMESAALSNPSETTATEFARRPITILMVENTTAIRMLATAARCAVLEAADILYNVGMKRALLVLGGLLVLVLAAILAIPFLIDPNEFRPRLESKLSENLHRAVK